MLALIVVMLVTALVVIAFVTARTTKSPLVVLTPMSLKWLVDQKREHNA